MLRFVILLCFLFSFSAHARPMPRVEDEPQSRLTYDIGVSSGKTNDLTYTEYNLGLNWWLGSWFAWRNALFGRSQQGEKTIYGLDTSFRASETAKLGDESSLN